MMGETHKGLASDPGICCRKVVLKGSMSLRHTLSANAVFFQNPVRMSFALGVADSSASQVVAQYENVQ